jgi:hypothetical protein
VSPAIAAQICARHRACHGESQGPLGQHQGRAPRGASSLILEHGSHKGLKAPRAPPRHANPQALCLIRIVAPVRSQGRAPRGTPSLPPPERGRARRFKRPVGLSLNPKSFLVGWSRGGSFAVAARAARGAGAPPRTHLGVRRPTPSARNPEDTLNPKLREMRERRRQHRAL